MDAVVTAFLTESSHTIVELNLYRSGFILTPCTPCTPHPAPFLCRNFVSHMSGLHQAHVISSEALFNCINNMQDVMKVLHTVHCTLHAAHCTLHTAHCILYTAHCIADMAKWAQGMLSACRTGTLLC